MKTTLLLLALITSVSFQALATDTKQAETEVIIIDIELESIEGKEACPECMMDVQIFDSEFNLIKTGKMSIFEATQDAELELMIENSGLLMQTKTSFIYQIED